MTIVILAAGASRRFGRPKLLETIDGRSLIGRALEASAAWPTVVVASPAVAEAVRAVKHDARVLINAEPDRGMNRSLAIADAAIAPGEALAIVLADLPDCEADTIATVLDAFAIEACDVLVPRSGERPGHPVVFGPRARALIAELPDGDTLHAVRDAPGLRRRTIDLYDGGAFADIDTEGDLAARRARGTHPD